LLSFEDKPPDLKLKARYATGTYGELLHWLENDMIDAAVVTPGVYARLAGSQWVYYGSLKGSEGPSVWLKRKGTDPLKDPAKLEVLAVDPLSVSGFLNPVAALEASGVHLRPDQIRFTYSHTASLRYLAASEGPVMACVWESAWKRHPDPNLEVVSVQGMEGYTAPPVALIGRPGLKLKDLPGFTYDPRYDALIRAIPVLPASLQEFAGRPLDRVDLDDLVATLQHYNATHPKPARFGVVLAGGGAKCSYQAGAMRALEEKLAAARLDVDVVVGTSGGAINAISVAMGLPRTEAGYADVKTAWSALDQREIICPPRAVRVNMWCWFASIAGLIILALSYRLRLHSGVALCLTALLGGLMTWASHLSLPWFRQHSTVQHAWAWLSWGIEGAGILLMVAAFLGIFLRKKNLTLPLARLLIAGVTLLPLVQTWTICFGEEYVSENKGLEAILTRSFGKLVNGECARRNLPAVTGATMQDLSRGVFERKLLQRDLVLTASPLTDPKLKLPGEFYFYASPQGHPAPGFGRRGVALADRPELLFDALLGSAAIYPLFPSRHIDDLPAPGQSVELVDGSFAHRSPLEAAVAWGATHVLLIEASTQEVSPRGKLLDNFGAALNYLYDEAQLVDVRMKGQTALFTLYPSVPHIGLLDFSAGFIEASIEKGYREASGAPTAADQRGGALQKELGPPVFSK